ncbi:piwi-like protein 1 [Aplysia californica]|uniref:Piwi-like protein 1 n=1 Tax=Aplysia californica TaxID=6500 RepID=A0ABM0JKY5_APLCA|nr:piwi-like protein 1 [Aplysia californica]
MSGQQPGQGRARGRGGRGRRPQQPAPPGQAPEPAAPAPQQPPGGAGAAPAAPVGRGRSRGARQADPGQAQQPVVMPQQAPVAGLGPEAVTGGRGVQRGGGRERPTAGGNGDGGAPVSQMGQLSLSGKPEYRRRAPYEKYVEKRYKEDTKACVGTIGNKANLMANYFEVRFWAEKKIFQYHVDFKPPVENHRVKHALIASLQNETGTVQLFDGGILYLCRLLAKDPMVLYATRTFDNAKIEVTFTSKGEVIPASPQFLQIANILMKKIQISLGMKQIRDHYYNMNQAIQIPRHKLEVMPGFTTSIHKYDGGNLLGVDIIHKILRMDTFLEGMYNLYDTLEMNRQLSTFQEVCYKNYVGSIVLTRYNNKTYKVDDIAWNMRPKDTFEKGGEQISYVQYYQDNWNITIRDKDQPLLVSRPTERDRRRGDEQNLYLLPELCTITGLSDQVRSDFKVMQDLAVHTRIAPPQRVNTLETFARQINSNEEAQKVLQPWGMTIAPKVVEMQGRELNAEKLLVKNPKEKATMEISYDIQYADWSRNMRNIHLLNAVPMTNWLVIYPSRCGQVAGELSDCLIRVGKGMGMQIMQPCGVEITSDRNESYLQAIRQNLNPQVQMIVTVVPNNKKDRYDAIKKSCCIDNPVPSQVVLQKTLSKQQGLMSVATKIAIQLNCKMGGEVWGAVIPVKGMMIIGLDTYHDSANKNQSVGAMVASLNKECTRYYCKTEYHDKKAEIMQSLGVLVTGALRKFHETNQANPTRVIVYRDGVGDGQLDAVFQSEKEQIEQAFRMAGGESFKPALTMVIVKKRINTRIFKRAEKVMNPQPGSVVDTFITKQEWYDFFLVSQSVRQGTVSPTSYNVIFDESGLKPDHLQQLTYKMTHLYFNWQGTIRVPAPCQYAHKLAFLQGQSLHREFSAHLSDKLFFL